MNGQFICDPCHQMDGEDLIKATIIRRTSDNPFVIAEKLLQSPAVKMHGPEYHFLVRAVLNAALYNLTGEQEKKERGFKTAGQSAELVKGDLTGRLANAGR